MKIFSDNPVAVNTTYDAWWITSLWVSAPDPSVPAQLQVSFARYDGSTITGQRKAYRLADIEAKCTPSEGVQKVIEALLALPTDAEKAAVIFTVLPVVLGAIAKTDSAID